MDIEPAREVGMGERFPPDRTAHCRIYGQECYRSEYVENEWVQEEEWFAPESSPGAAQYFCDLSTSCPRLLTAQVYHRVLPLSLIHISEPTRRTPISYAVFCLKKKKQ